MKKTTRSNWLKVRANFTEKSFSLFLFGFASTERFTLGSIRIELHQILLTSRDSRDSQVHGIRNQILHEVYVYCVKIAEVWLDARVRGRTRNEKRIRWSIKDRSNEKRVRERERKEYVFIKTLKAVRNSRKNIWPDVISWLLYYYYIIFLKQWRYTFLHRLRIKSYSTLYKSLQSSAIISILESIEEFVSARG